MLGTLLQLVNTGGLNEAVGFAGWQQSHSGGGGGDGSGSSTVPISRFSKAFEAFTQVVKGISLEKKGHFCVLERNRYIALFKKTRFSRYFNYQ